MRLLVTRPEPDASRQADALRARGHEPVLAPLFRMEPIGNVSIPLSDIAALIVTSRNALRALKQHPSLPQALRLPCYAVGRATAAAARDLGFANVVEGSGTGEGLAALIRERGDAGPFLHVSGQDIAFDMVAALQRGGLQAARVPIYRTEPASVIPPAAVGLLREGALDGVILMSPRTAATFSGLVHEAGLAQASERLRAFCLSQAVAGALGPLKPAICIAAAPREEEVLALIDAEAAS